MWLYTWVNGLQLTGEYAKIRTNRDRLAIFPPSLPGDLSLGDWDKKSLLSAGLILVGFCVMSVSVFGPLLVNTGDHANR
jgi:hypothetical protein